MTDAPSILEFSEDLATQEAPPALPMNEYPAKIINAMPKVSQNSGNTYLALTFHISADDYPADFEGDPDGATLTYNRLVVEDKPQARWRLRKFLEAVGAPLSKSIDPNSLIGLTATVSVTNSEWDGETRAEIKSISAP